MARPPETFPPQEITDQVSDFLQEIRGYLAYDPDNIRRLFAMFSYLGKGEITDIDRVLAGVEPLLQDHPHLVALFNGLVDPVRRGLEFLEWAKKALGGADYNRFVALIYIVDEDRTLDAHQVYQKFKELLGKKHDDLLRGLAVFLPTKYVPPPPRKERRRRPERKHPSYACADAPESSRPIRNKKLRVIDVGPTPDPACFTDTGAAGCSRARRPRMSKYDYEYDDPLPKRKPASCAVSVVDDGTSSRPSKAKKPRADDSMSRHAPIGGADWARDSVRVAAAPVPDANASEVMRSREAWEFETGYSLLDATLKRAVKVRDELKHLNGARVSLDELFPRPEIQGYLVKMYHGKWNRMRQFLEHGGDHTAFALEAIVMRLTAKDADAVDEAWRRQDPDRAAQRLQELAQERVRESKEQQRQP